MKIYYNWMIVYYRKIFGIGVWKNKDFDLFQNGFDQNYLKWHFQTGQKFSKVMNGVG